MRFSIATIAASLVAGVLADDYNNTPPVQYTTDVVYSYVTYCPEATTLTYGGATYVVSTPTSLTLTGGAYTVQTPVYTTTSTICNSCSSTAPPASTPLASPPVVYPGAPAVSSVSPANQGSPGYPGSPGSIVSPASSPSSPPPGYPLPSNTIPASAKPQFTGGAPRAVIGAGAGLAGILGVAFLL